MKEKYSAVSDGASHMQHGETAGYLGYAVLWTALNVTLPTAYRRAVGEGDWNMYEKKAGQVIDEVKKAVVGKDDCIRKVMLAMVAGGHILLDDIPGVGKTTMAVAFSRACGMKQNRVQFTPDVLPSDITGYSIYRKETGNFIYQPGAAMCNLLLADEINRTSPKTQSALLEVMEERTVTVDGVTRQVPRPFLVIATQNPVGSAGTQMLPESQLDRFMICMTMGYPKVQDEIAILKDRGGRNPIDDVSPVIQVEELLAMQAEAEQIFIHDRIYEYLAELAAETRRDPMLDLGISPRGTLALAQMSRACAYLAGRDYVLPSDVEDIFADVTLHRIHLSSRARAGHVTKEEAARGILERTARPTVKRRQA